MFGPTPVPTSVFSLPSTFLKPAAPPTATLLLAKPSPLLSLNASATSPRAVFSAATSLKISASSPKALLPNPILLPASAAAPTALLKTPSVLRRSALKPTAVLPSARPAAVTSLNASALAPTAVLPIAVKLAKSAKEPTAVLPSELLFSSAAAPTAVLSSPWLNNSAAVPRAVFLLNPLLRSSDAAPTEVLKLPSWLAKAENQPNAEFPTPLPLALKRRALNPSAVLKKPTAPGSGVSVAACTCGQSARLTIVSPRRHEDNTLIRISEYMRCVFPLFPGHVLFLVYCHWAPSRQRTRRVKVFVCFGAIRVDTEFQLLVSILFLNSFFRGERQRPAKR